MLKLCLQNSTQYNNAKNTTSILPKSVAKPDQPSVSEIFPDASACSTKNALHGSIPM